MFDAEYLDRLAAKMRQSEKESQHRRAVARVAEPLLAGLPMAGTRHFSPEQFKALVQYLHEGDRPQIAKALKRGRFRVSSLEFVRDDNKTENVATISDFSRMHGVPRKTLHNRVANAGLNSVSIGNKKLYEIKELSLLLAKV